MDAQVTALINYYAREGQVHHVQTTCNDLLKRGSSPLLLFWRAYGLLAEGSSAEVRIHMQRSRLYDALAHIQVSNMFIMVATSQGSCRVHGQRCLTLGVRRQYISIHCCNAP